MALPSTYTLAVGRLPELFKKIRDGQAPQQFTQQLLKDWGFSSSNDRAALPLLKAIGFLSPDGKPTNICHDYRDHSRSKVVMGQALKSAYSDIFLIKEHPTEADKSAVQGKFKSYHNTSDNVASLMMKTFYALLNLADLKTPVEPSPKTIKKEEPVLEGPTVEAQRTPSGFQLAGLHYNIQIHLPATKGAVLFCFENEVRDFVRETLLEKEGADWQEKLPPKIKEHAEGRQAAATKDSWLEGEKSDLLGFIEFGHLAQIIIAKWEHFQVIPSQHWLKQRMDEMEKVRHFIAHNRMLLPSEFQRLYMYIADWNRVVGL